MKNRVAGDRASGRAASRQAGFTAMEMVVGVAVISIVTVLAVAQQRAQQSMRITTSTRLFAQYLEKARIDSKRRRAVNPAQQAGVRIVSPEVYNVTLDFNGTGTPQTRTVELPEGVTFDFEEPVLIRFDWQGQPTTDAQITFTGSHGSQSPVINVSEFGDVAVEGAARHLPTNANVNVRGTAVTGNTNIDNRVRLNSNQ
jgi:prepilin-type N-terminal cleavage/methylation domain-containing protein